MAVAAELGGGEVAHRLGVVAATSRPVAALALPLLRMTAAAWPPLARRCDRETVTGAAVMRLLVNTAAAATGRPSAVATSDRSGAPLVLDAGSRTRGDEPASGGDAHG